MSLREVRCSISAYVVLTLAGLGLGVATVWPSQLMAQSKADYAPASVRAVPGAQCKLHAAGAAATSGIPVFTDQDGYARFFAERTAAGDAAQKMVLDCTDAAGKAKSFAVDLAAEDTFAARPVDIGKLSGVARPALTVDPMSKSQAELLKEGYGLRPDPTEGPAAYAAWLAAAKQAGRVLHSKAGMQPHPDTRRTLLPSAGVTTAKDPNWVGAELTGSATYTQTQATFNVPTGIPHGDGTGDSSISIWTGLDGNGGPPLIQAGIDVDTTGNTASYSVFREYCCGQPINNNFNTSVSPNPGDEIFTQSWYCDSTGAISETSHYGCAYLIDKTTGAILNCVDPNDSSCASVPALPAWKGFGSSAEYVIELELQPDFTDFTPAVVMHGDAYSKKLKKWVDVSTDSQVTQMVDFTNSKKTTMGVIIGGGDEVTFVVGKPATKLQNSPQPKPTEDDDTQITRDGVKIHICPTGNVMIGVDAKNNRFLCSAEFSLQNPESLWVDKDTHKTFTYGGGSHSVHVCPANMVMVGWQEEKNWLVCVGDLGSGYVPSPGFGTVKVNGPGGTQVPEPKHTSEKMHACDASGETGPYAMSGIEATDNVLICTDGAATARLQ